MNPTAMAGRLIERGMVVRCQRASTLEEQNLVIVTRMKLCMRRLLIPCSFPKGGDPARSGLIPAAQCADEGDIESEGTRFEIGDCSPVCDQRVLRRKNLEIGGKPSEITVLHNAVCVFRCHECIAAGREPLAERARTGRRA